jgi:AraC-like DNA-binding protein
MRPLVRSATLNGYVEVARSLGLDPAALMREHDLDPTDLSVPDRWISAPSVARLLQASAAAAGRSDFALRLAELRRLTTLGPLSVVLREEPDLRSLLGLLMRHEHSYNEALRTQLAEREGIATIQLWFEFGEPTPSGQALALGVGALFGIIRESLGDGWRPLAVCFTAPPPDEVAAYQRHFGPGLRFEHEFSGLVMYSADLDARNTLADPLMRPYAQQILSSVVAERARTTSDRVRELVELLLPLGRCSIDHVARSLRMDSRTLQRHLSAEGTSFSSILHATRAGLAERHLSSDRYTVSEVGFVLGFTSSSAFSRWFHQQFGLSPREWRRASIGH